MGSDGIGASEILSGFKNNSLTHNYCNGAWVFGPEKRVIRSLDIEP